MPPLPPRSTPGPTPSSTPAPESTINYVLLRSQMQSNKVQPELHEGLLKAVRIIIESDLNIQELREALNHIKKGEYAAGAVEATAAALKGAGTASEFAAGESDKALKLTAMGTNELATTAGMLKILQAGAKASPTRVGAVVVIAFAQKVLALTGVSVESDRAKMYAAVAKLLVDGALAVETKGGGSPLVMALTMFGLLLDIADVYESCVKFQNGLKKEAPAPFSAVPTPGPTPPPPAAKPVLRPWPPPRPV